MLPPISYKESNSLNGMERWNFSTVLIETATWRKEWNIWFRELFLQVWEIGSDRRIPRSELTWRSSSSREQLSSSATVQTPKNREASQPEPPTSSLVWPVCKFPRVPSFSFFLSLPSFLPSFHSLYNKANVCIESL